MFVFMLLFHLLYLLTILPLRWNRDEYTVIVVLLEYAWLLVAADCWTADTTSSSGSNSGNLCFSVGVSCYYSNAQPGRRVTSLYNCRCPPFVSVARRVLTRSLTARRTRRNHLTAGCQVESQFSTTRRRAGAHFSRALVSCSGCSAHRAALPADVAHRQHSLSVNQRVSDITSSSFGHLLRSGCRPLSTRQIKWL